MTNNKHDNRLLELDVLRGLAAVAVVLFHYTVRYDELFSFATPPAFRARFGEYGVEIFFCLSGFVIFMTLQRTRQPLDFIVSRVARLWPAFIAAGLVTYLAVRDIGLPGRQVSVGQALENLTMIPELLHVPLVDPAYWSLQVELIFYCWMLLAFTLGLLGRIRTLLWLALVPPLVYWGVHAFLQRDLSWFAGNLLMVKYVPYFVIGIAAYLVRMRGAIKGQDLALLGAACAVAAICESRIEGLVAVIGSVILCAIATGRVRWLAQRPLLFLGTISYTLYLIHQNMGYLVIRALTGQGVGTNLAVVCAIAVSIGLATVITFVVEQPARDWIRDFHRSIRADGSSSPRAILRDT